VWQHLSVPISDRGAVPVEKHQTGKERISSAESIGLGLMVCLFFCQVFEHHCEALSWLFYQLGNTEESIAEYTCHHYIDLIQSGWQVPRMLPENTYSSNHGSCHPGVRSPGLTVVADEEDAI
jgi:hypothetical protein